MNLWQYDNRELLKTAEMSHWMGDQRFADYVMEELVCRIVEEHPPDGERMEVEIEESSEETVSSAEGEEDDDEYYYIRRGEN